MFIKRGVHILLSGIIVLLVSLFIDKKYSEPDYLEITSSFQEKLHQKEEKLKLVLKNYDLAEKNLPASDLFEKDGIAVFVLKNDKILFWSENSIPVNNAQYLNSGIMLLENGWYKVLTHKNEDVTIAAMLLIKNEYAYENQYLTNDFQKDFLLPSGTKLTTEKNEGTFPVYSSENEYLFSLKFSETDYSGTLLNAALSGYVLFLLLIMLFITRMCGNFGKSKGNLSCLIFFISVILLRYLMILFEFPGLLYMQPLFSPVFYACSNIFPSLGDFLINAILLFTISLFLHKYLDLETILHKKRWFAVLRIIFLIFLLGIGLLIKNIIVGLIVNSSVSFNVNNLFELSFYSLAGFTGIVMLFFSFFFAADKLILSHLRFRKKQGYSFTNIILSAVVASVLSGYIFTKYGSEKEHSHRKLLAEKLIVERDHVAEFLFADVAEKMLQNTVIQKELQSLPGSKELITSQIMSNYMSGYWTKYDVQITICRLKDSLLVQPENILKHCGYFFEEMMSKICDETESPGFYHLSNNNGRTSYLAKVNFPEGEIYIELDSKFIPMNSGYPELLLDKEITKNTEQDIKNYSYAKYQKGKLAEKSGEYAYNISSEQYDLPSDQFYSFASIDNFSHLIYKTNTGDIIILSKREDSVFDIIIRISYLFAIFCFGILIFVIIKKFPERHNFFQPNFKKRIEIAMLFILFIALFPIGLGTKYYIENEHRNKNYENIREKIESVLIEVEHKLAAEEKLTDNLREYLSFILTKFSYVFFTDITLYDLNGNLLASSRPEIFEEGLIGEKMNSIAWQQLAINSKTEFVHEEKIGKLKYLSAYVPFQNQNNKLLAYLNLPYFAKQSELEQELSIILAALINIYVLLILITIIVALFLTNRIIYPLRMIQEKLAVVKIGSVNKPINWKSNDEIGELVKVYNQMLDEIKKSSDMLARSERESAWREMARQIAHEIKNPLTPMKLSVQHLEKSWNEKAPDWDKKLHKFTQTLIQQIDTLSFIASSFSDFAGTQAVNIMPVDIAQIIENAIELYKDNKGTTIVFKNGATLEPLVFADRKQLLQVLNNLIKNAIQSIPAEKDGIIDIVISEDNDKYVIRLSDNGSGIIEEEKEKIFVPNFTTKTGGMGLGLAIVKNIIENFSGKIWFETKPGVGSSFYFCLPKYKESK